MGYILLLVWIFFCQLHGGLLLAIRQAYVLLVELTVVVLVVSLIFWVVLFLVKSINGKE